VPLLAETGQPVALESSGGAGTVILIFRGAWCPYCRAELGRLAKEERRFHDPHVQVFGVSPDSPDKHAQVRQLLRLPFPLLSDPGESVINQCASAHCVLIYDRHGILKWGSFSDKWRSPIDYAAVLELARELR
jgi:peroxiredoxin